MFDQSKVSSLLQRIRERDRELGATLDEVLERKRAPRSGTNEIIDLEGLSIGDEPLALESIALAEGRPVLSVVNDAAVLNLTGDDKALWFGRLGSAKAVLGAAIPSVGRIQVQGHSRYSWIGTGWVVADDVMVTNRHVAREFAYRSNDVYVFDEAVGGGRMKTDVDYLAEQGRPAKKLQRIVEVLHIEPQGGPDLAFLRLDDTADGAPIRLSQTLPAVDTFVAILGYPARDSRVPDTALMERLFGGVYDCKRLAPGQIDSASSTSVSHDCTTLGGNSGSVLLDITTGEAVGLHFSGRFLVTNYAVPAPVVLDRLDSIRRLNLRRRSRPIESITPATQPTASSNSSSIQLTIPLTVTITADVLGITTSTSASTSTPTSASPTGSTRSSATLIPRREPRESDVADRFDDVIDNEAAPEDYANRTGYDEAFLDDGIAVPMPEIERGLADVLFFEDRGNPAEYELRYEHFSVVMNKRRRMCFFSGANIDGARSKRKTPRSGWRRDPRIAEHDQIRDECYGNAPKFSRGHMTRREDPIWGTAEEAARGNSDSMHVTNAVPQMQTFNAGIWLRLEDYALAHARTDKMRLCVFTGPFLRKSDPAKFDVQIPVEFWKVLAFINDDSDELSATGYSISQADALSDTEFVFGEFETYQRPLSWIENRAGLSFGSLTSADRFGENETLQSKPLSSEGDIQW